MPTIDFVESKSYPHVRELVERPDKTADERALLSYWGKLGNESRKRKRVAATNLPLFPSVKNLDPHREFPKHHVCYRGSNFCYLELKPRFKREVHPSEPTMSFESWRLIYAWVQSPDGRAQVATERAMMDAGSNLDTCPID